MPTAPPPRPDPRTGPMLVLADEPRFKLLVAGAGAVVLVAALAFWSMSASSRDAADADQAAAVRHDAHRLVIGLLEADRAHRAYLLTADPAFLVGQDVAQRAVDGWLAQLGTEAPPTLDPEIAAVTAMVRSTRSTMALAIQQLHGGDRPAALATLRVGEDRRSREHVLENLDSVVEALNQSTRSTQQTRDTTQVAQVVIVVSSGLAVAALFLGIVALKRRTLALARALAEVTHQADELGHRGAALREAVAALGVTNTALARSNRDLDQFAYAASHDLKAPLRAISSLATWIEEDLAGNLDGNLVEHLRLMRSRVERLQLLIEGILAYSRAGREAATETVEVRDQVRCITELVPPPAGVEVVVAPGPWPKLRTVAVQLQQVWMNLLGNAYQHGKRGDGGGRVTLSCADAADGSWRFGVTDDGCGIEPRFQERIFEMFQRLDPRDKVEGAGVGLAIVRKLVTAHGGKVWVEATAGCGTSMQFTWRGAP